MAEIPTRGMVVNAGRMLTIHNLPDPGGAPGTNRKLREDGSLKLREDGSFKLRE